jgi:hypothetical protein
MEIGDKVIINPNIPDKAWSKNGYGFYYASMRKPGIFVLEEKDSKGGFFINGFSYDEEWLLPVPLFKAGDSVTIREDLKESMSCPYGITDGMVGLKGMQFNVEKVSIANRADRDIEILGDDGCLYNINGPGSKFSWSSPMFDLSNYKFKIKSNESRLQKQESPLRGGSRELTSGVRCRVNKARVTVSSPGYKEVIGRG